jgi:CO/xanthine dehydrogenase Mo-binding subunit
MKNPLLVKGSPPPLLDREFTIVGKPVNRRDALEKVTGRAEYSGDIRLPNMLHGKILRCPYPRARIVRLDTRGAENLPGVKAILTKENTRGWLTYWYKIPQIAFPECVTYEGQEVAAVAAEDITTAQKALDSIHVEYEILPPTLNAEKALTEPRPPLIADEEYPGSEVFDRKEYVISRGDITKGFQAADVVIEDTYTTQTQYHGTIQTRACVASWDGKNLTLWDAIQGVWITKETMAQSFGISPENVRVIVKYLGGGFGSKANSYRISYYAAKLSMLTGRPVRLEHSRREEFLVHAHRWDCKIDLKMGAKKDGALVAISQTAIVNIGAAAWKENYFPQMIIWHTSNLYECPNVDLKQVGVYTNLQLTGPQRGPLNMPAIFALESHMDRMAEALGMDPLEFRLKNYTMYGADETSEAIYVTKSGTTGEGVKSALNEDSRRIPYSSKKLDECMKRVTASIGWEKRKEYQVTKGYTKRRGVGMASFIVFQGVGLPPYEAHADVTIEHDGVIRLYIGVVDIGAGQQTIFSMIAAEELGVNLDDMVTIYGDTENTRYAPSCFASRCTAEMGPAVLKAAAEARQRLFELVAPTLGVRPEELESKWGTIYVKKNPAVSMGFAAACRHIDPESPLKGSGSRSPNPHDPCFATFGAHAVEVEVDTGTGQVDIVKVAAAHDFGRAINPKLCTSQIYGGIEFGVGYALSEEGLFDPRTGKFLNPNLYLYKMPTALDMPLYVDPILVEGEDPYFAYSAKGAGENTSTPLPAAIRNAIYNATGAWFNHLPITADKILAAMKEKEKGREKGCCTNCLTLST